MRRTYTRAAPRSRRRCRRARQGQGTFEFVKKVAINPLNMTLKRILDSDAAHLALSKAIKTVNNGLSNG